MAGTAPAAVPLGSEFTYQAQLKLDGVPLNGQVDMRFTLYDAATLGNQVGTTVIFDGQAGNGAPVDVTDGLLTVRPDFGANVFDGTALWLEIDVRSPHDPTDTALYDMLAPRQPQTATPYALQTQGLFVDDAGNVVLAPNEGNSATGGIATVGGGQNNVSNLGGTVAGGMRNTASGAGGFVGGGSTNVASGGSATVPGGLANTAAGRHSFAAGTQAKANHDGAFVWADDTGVDFASTSANQFLIRAAGGVGIGEMDPSAALDVVGTTELNGGVSPDIASTFRA